jgi:6-phosphofructokinase 1
MTRKKTLGILSGGGPAPGINSVINAATIEAINLGWDVLGIHKGYAGLLDGGTIAPLTLEEVALLHFRGGSILGTSRTNPAKSPETLAEAHRNLQKHGIDMLLTIGGDDTSYGASELARVAPELLFVHVPKTIDNDLPLPDNMPTFGYETARHEGVRQLEALLWDARTTDRWFIVVCMGRTAGHLALGMARAADASLAIIPEEFEGRHTTLDELTDILEASVIKERARGIHWGLAVLAEGLIESLDPADLTSLGDDVPRDAFGHIRLADLDLGRILGRRLEDRLKARRISKRVVDIRIGYELRCASPIPFDIEYTRQLGSASIQFLANGGSHAIMSIRNGMPSPIRFEDVRDPDTGRIRVRRVDTRAESYRAARRYMRRLTRKDIDSADELAALASAANTTPADFQARFAYLVQNEPDSYSWNDEVRHALADLLRKNVST